eukprot:gene300-biopygen280
MNGNVERFQGTLRNAIRSNLQGTGARLWGWCAKYVWCIYNRLDKQKRKPPFHARHGRDPDLTRLRRFGSLRHGRVCQDTSLTKLGDRWERGTFLGFSRNSCYLVGLHRPGPRCAEGFRFSVFEDRCVKVDGSIVAQKVDHLVRFHEGTYTPYSLPSNLDECDVPGDGVGSDGVRAVAHGGSGRPAVVAPMAPDASRSKVPHSDKKAVVGDVPLVSDGNVGGNQDDCSQHSAPDANASDSDSDWVPKNVPMKSISTPAASPVVRRVQEPVQNQASSSSSGSAKTDPSQGNPSVGLPVEANDPRVYWEDGVKKKRKGRLPGTKRQEHWQKPGPKPKINMLRGGGNQYQACC